MKQVWVGLAIQPEIPKLSLVCVEKIRRVAMTKAKRKVPTATSWRVFVLNNDTDRFCTQVQEWLVKYGWTLEMARDHIRAIGGVLMKMTKNKETHDVPLQRAPRRRDDPEPQDKEGRDPEVVPSSPLEQ